MYDEEKIRADDLSLQFEPFDRKYKELERKYNEIVDNHTPCADKISVYVSLLEEANDSIQRLKADIIMYSVKINPLETRIKELEGELQNSQVWKK